MTSNSRIRPAMRFPCAISAILGKRVVLRFGRADVLLTRIRKTWSIVLAGYVEEIGRRLSGRHGSGVIRGDVLAAARRHRVHLLLTPGDLAPDARPAFAAELRTAAALDAAGEGELHRLLSALRTQRIDALLMKGAGLAYTVYRAPHLRPRVDTDLLVRPESIDAAGRVLVDAGWRRDVEPSFALAASQRHYAKPGPLDQPWRVDLHWRIANPHVFANAVTFDELSAAAIDVPALGEAARTLGYAHALYVGACTASPTMTTPSTSCGCGTSTCSPSASLTTNAAASSPSRRAPR